MAACCIGRHGTETADARLSGWVSVLLQRRCHAHLKRCHHALNIYAYPLLEADWKHRESVKDMLRVQCDIEGMS